MDYQKTPINNNVKAASSKMLTLAAEKLSTPQLLWLLIKRHKVALLATSNIILLLSFVFPPWLDVALSAVK